MTKKEKEEKSLIRSIISTISVIIFTAIISYGFATYGNERSIAESDHDRIIKIEVIQEKQQEDYNETKQDVKDVKELLTRLLTKLDIDTTTTKPDVAIVPYVSSESALIAFKTTE